MCTYVYKLRHLKLEEKPLVLKMATDQNIQQLTFTVGVDMQAINREVGPLALSTTKPYRMRRSSQPAIIARQIDLGQEAADGGHGSRGTLGNLPIEILYMIFERMDVQTFVMMRGVCKSIKVCTHCTIYSVLLQYAG